MNRKTSQLPPLRLQLVEELPEGYPLLENFFNWKPVGEVAGTLKANKTRDDLLFFAIEKKGTYKLRQKAFRGERGHKLLSEVQSEDPAIKTIALFWDQHLPRLVGASRACPHFSRFVFLLFQEGFHQLNLRWVGSSQGVQGQDAPFPQVHHHEEPM